MNHINKYTAFILLCLSIPAMTFAQQVHVLIDYQHPAQVIESFGASDAWGCQFAGVWPEEKRSRMAELLFSTKSDASGQPLGIGLNFWRFSIGAGSAEQGDASTIRDEWKRQASFLSLSGSYNWNAMPGQVWFLNAAKKHGVKNFLAFVNSPHVLFTLNNRAYSDAGQCNLNFDKLNNFTDDLVATIGGIKKLTGISLDYLSPVNEPQWNWADPKQEGCPYTNEEIARVVRNLSKKLNDQKLNTKIQIGDAGQLDYLYGQGKAKGHQISAFFDKNSDSYLGNLSNLDRSISGHSYFTTSPQKKSVGIREKVAAEVAKVKGLRYWMSEYCILGDDSLQGPKRDLGMTTALFVAKLIHDDLSISNATSWQWWLAISPNDYKDGLIYIDRNKQDGNVYDSKLLWAMGNYSRFIRPGSVRLPVSFEGYDSSKLQISAYRSSGKIITVIVNKSRSEIAINFDDSTRKFNRTESYVTSAVANLAPGNVYKGNDVIKVLPESVTTLISN